MEELDFLYRELGKLQRHITTSQQKLLILVEGVDASGKSGLIRRVLKYLDPKEAYGVRLSTPTERERSQWYFQRYVPHLPGGGEIALFDRSWYNRAGLERVMGFASLQEVEAFYRDVVLFERLLVSSGVLLCKFYLSISKEEQAKRLQKRDLDTLRPFRVTALDRVAVAHYEAYQEAAEEMFCRTSTEEAPWVVIRCDQKREARKAFLTSLVSRLTYPEKKTLSSPAFVFVAPNSKGGGHDNNAQPGGHEGELSAL